MSSKSKSFLCLAALAAVLNANGLVAAEPDAVPRGRPDQPGRGQRPGGGMQQRGGFPIEMILNPEQRAEFRNEMEGQRDRQRELDEKTMNLRRQLDDLLFAEKLDEKAVKEKSAAIAELDAERSLIRARAFAKVRPSLTKEQMERLEEMRANLARGPRPGGGAGGDFRPPGDEDRRPGDRFDRPRPPRPPGEPGGDDVLPPPAPRPPQGPPPPGQDRR